MVLLNNIAAATEAAIALTSEQQGFYCDQFNNLSSIIAHETTTGPEIWHDLDGQVDIFVSAVGSGGTFLGVSKYLKQQQSHPYCVAVEPSGAEIV